MTQDSRAKAEPEGEYQHLNHGDIIQDGDEVEDESGNWLPAQRCVGEPAPDPKYTPHRWYRRRTPQPATVPEGFSVFRADGGMTAETPQGGYVTVRRSQAGNSAADEVLYDLALVLSAAQEGES